MSYCLFAILLIVIARYPPQVHSIVPPLYLPDDLTTDRAWIAKAVEQHNIHRRKHGVPDLIFNEEIAKISQNWANHIAILNTLRHSPGNTRPGMGENIFMWSRVPLSATVGPTTPADVWYGEKHRYNFTLSRGTGTTGHFTQVVWKSSREIGIALACCRDDNGITKKCCAVAIYCPAGNSGGYEDNVLPPLNQSMPSDRAGNSLTSSVLPIISWRNYGFILIFSLGATSVLSYFISIAIF